MKTTLIAAILGAAISAGLADASTTTKAVLHFTPAAGAKVSTSLPTFTITTSGFDPTLTDDNPSVVISTSFQVDSNGQLSQANLPCLLPATPTGPASHIYRAHESAAAGPLSLSFCQLKPGVKYYWQIQFLFNYATETVAPGVVTCSGVYCHTRVMTLKYLP